jgi:hypothetical protein
MLFLFSRRNLHLLLFTLFILSLLFSLFLVSPSLTKGPTRVLRSTSSDAGDDELPLSPDDLFFFETSFDGGNPLERHLLHPPPPIDDLPSFEEYSPLNRVSNLTNYVIFDEASEGLGDRLRGVVTSFFFSRLMGRKFLLLEELVGGRENMAPGGYNWAEEQVSEVYARSPSHPYAIRTFGLGKDEVLINFDFSDVRKFEMIRFTSNLMSVDLLRRAPALRFDEALPAHRSLEAINRQGQIWRYALHHLFRPGPKVGPLLEELARRHLVRGTFKIGIHSRTDDGELISGTSKGASRMQESQRNHLQCLVLRALWEWKRLSLQLKLERFPRGPVFFLSADRSSSLVFLKAWLRKLGFPCFTGEDHGSVSHFRDQGKDQTRTFLDWWLFTKMDLILATPSGFSASASRFECTPFLLYDPKVEKEDAEMCNAFVDYRERGLCFPVEDYDLLGDRWLKSFLA